MIFRDRVEAGNKLGSALAKYRGLAEVVLSIPSGGSICATQVARFLGLPHDLVLINTISHPHSSEYAVGAVNENGAVILRSEAAILDKQWLDTEIERKKMDIRRRRHILLTNRPSTALHKKTVLLIDEGLDDHLPMQSAIEYVKSHRVDRIIVAVPFASTESARKVEELVDDFVALHLADEKVNLSRHYVDYKEIPDKEVVTIIERHDL